MEKEIFINNETNFAAEVSSVFHLLCALSFANKLSKEQYVKGIIIIRCHFIENEPIDEKIIEFENLNIDLISFKNDYKYIDIKSKNDDEKYFETDGKFYLLSIKVPNLAMYFRFKKATKKKICIVLIDEGTGTYYNFSGFLYPFKTLFKKIIVNLYLSQIKSFFLLQKHRNKLIPNTDVTENLVEVIDKYNKIFPFLERNRYEKSESKYVILISGLFIEMGIISLEEYTSKLNILKDFLEKKGMRLLIKPYQSENLEKYKNMKFEILPWDLSCEVLFPIVNPVLTLGFFSTSMITGKVLYGISGVDISKIFGLNNNNSFAKKYNKYFRLFGDYLYRAESSDNLEEIVEEILVNKNSGIKN